MAPNRETATARLLINRLLVSQCPAVRGPLHCQSRSVKALAQGGDSGIRLFRLVDVQRHFAVVYACP